VGTSEKTTTIQRWKEWETKEFTFIEGVNVIRLRRTARQSAIEI
jgi:hypothetical protein